MGSGRFAEDISIKDEAQLTQLHRDVVGLLRSGGEYGAYDAVEHLAGRRAAILLTERGIIKSRPLSQSFCGPSTSKRAAEDGGSNNKLAGGSTSITVEDLSRHPMKKSRR